MESLPAQRRRLAWIPSCRASDSSGRTAFVRRPSSTSLRSARGALRADDADPVFRSGRREASRGSVRRPACRREDLPVNAEPLLDDRANDSRKGALHRA